MMRDSRHRRDRLPVRSTPGFVASSPPGGASQPPPLRLPKWAWGRQPGPPASRPVPAGGNFKPRAFLGSFARKAPRLLQNVW